SLMPLRLARYGVPLAQTAPAGLAAAGIEPALLSPAPRAQEAPPQAAAAIREQEGSHPKELRLRRRQTPDRPPGVPRDLRESSDAAAERFAVPYRKFIEQCQVEPTAAQWAFWLRDQYGISTGAGEPLPDAQLQPLLRVLHHCYGLPAVQTTDTGESEPADQSWYDYFHSAWRSFADERGTYPDAAALAAYVYERDATTGADGAPIAGEDVADFVAAFQKRESSQTGLPSEGGAEPGERGAGETVPETNASQPAPVGAAAQAARESRSPRVNAPLDQPPRAAHAGGLTAPDRYYLAWIEYQEQKGNEPSDKELSAFCADKGLLGRGNKAISPGNLRRHFMRWRVYNVWAQQRAHTETPAPVEVAQACADHGITGQHHKPITPSFIAEAAAEYESRWHALGHHHADTQPP
ncbi:hypothetical protein AB0E81_37920, partial [Streptomyces sp. NPDC033538]